MVKSIPQDQPKARPYRYEFATVKQLIPYEDDCLIGLESSEGCYLIPWSKSWGIWSKIEYNFFKSVRPKHKTYRGFLRQIHQLLRNY